MAANIDVQRPEGNSVKAGDNVGAIPFGVETEFEYVLKNVGDAPLTVGNKEPSIANAVGCAADTTNTPGVTVLGVGETFAFTVGITPSAASFSFDIDIESDDPDEPVLDVTVSGTSPTGGASHNPYATGQVRTRRSIQTNRRY